MFPPVKRKPRSVIRRSAVVMLATAALLLTIVGGFNFYVDSAGVLRDQTTTSNVKAYVAAMRQAKVGVPYTYYDRPIKLAVATTSTADCVVTGSSHVMTFRVDRNAVIGAECKALDNAGVSGASFEDSITIMGAALANPNVKHVYVGMDIWSLARHTSVRWRRVTQAFMQARHAFGLPDDVYETRGGETVEAQLRELFSLEYLRLNYREVKKSLRGKATLVYSTKQLTEADLRKKLALRSDGSLSYPSEFEPSPGDADLLITDQWMVPPYFDPQVVDEMRKAVKALQQAGKSVTFVIGPYHPTVFQCAKPRICEGMKVMDPVIRNLAAELNVQVIGGFEPAIFGLTRDSFIDFQHLRGSELHRLRILQPAEVEEVRSHISNPTN